MTRVVVPADGVRCQKLEARSQKWRAGRISECGARGRSAVTANRFQIPDCRLADTEEGDSRLTVAAHGLRVTAEFPTADWRLPTWEAREALSR